MSKKMTKNRLTIREQRREAQMKMYNKYISAIEKDPTLNKSQLKRELAEEFGYTSEASVHATIYKIENPK